MQLDVQRRLHEQLEVGSKTISRKCGEKEILTFNDADTEELAAED